MKDILWDFSRGYIDFWHISGAAGMVELMRRKIDLGIAQSPASYVDSLGNVVTVDHFSARRDDIDTVCALLCVQNFDQRASHSCRMLPSAMDE